MLPRHQSLCDTEGLRHRESRCRKGALSSFPLYLKYLRWQVRYHPLPLAQRVSHERREVPVFSLLKGREMKWMLENGPSVLGLERAPCSVNMLVPHSVIHHRGSGSQQQPHLLGVYEPAPDLLVRIWILARSPGRRWAPSSWRHSPDLELGWWWCCHRSSQRGWHHSPRL